MLIESIFQRMYAWYCFALPGSEKENAQSRHLNELAFQHEFLEVAKVELAHLDGFTNAIISFDFGVAGKEDGFDR